MKKSKSAEKRRRQLAAALATLGEYSGEAQRADEKLASYRLAAKSAVAYDDQLEQPTVLTPQIGDDEEQIDLDDQFATRRRRVKRQVYYKSGYNGSNKCHGFPLEVNVRSRIKMDQVFPIYGKSQMKKCVKVG